MPEPYDAVLLDLYDTIVWSEWFRLRDAIAARIGDDMEADRLQKAFEQTRPARGVGAFGSVEGDMAAVLEAAGVRHDATLVGELVELERDAPGQRRAPLRRRPPGPRVAPRARA